MSKENLTKATAFALPKDALKRADLGSSFAEYDLVRKNPDLFVETSAIRAAVDAESSKSIFVGRRGTGKTAVTYFLDQLDPKATVVLLPQIFSIVDNFIGGEVSDVQQRPFKTLVNSVKRALLDETVANWIENGHFTFRQNQAPEITRNRNEIEDLEFDNRVLESLRESWDYLDPGREKDWNRFDSRVKKLQDEIEVEAQNRKQVRILIDRIDEDWNGSEPAVTMLMALLHACVQLNAVVPRVKFMVFIRENMFDRVRQADKEFARIETAVVSLEWTREQLRELIERRLRRRLITKPALNGPTWQAFFKSSADKSSEDVVFSYCQYRPREVLTYCSFALEIAQSHNRTQIALEDLDTARTRFSESRLKEISDEYAENYPGLGTLLASFFGLGKRFTYKAIDDFVKKLLVNKTFTDESTKWIYRYTSPESFMTLLYGIGFAGIQDRSGVVRFRLHETQPLTPSDITSNSVLVIHETYTDALQLQDKLVPSIDEAFDLRLEGLIADLPEAFNAEEYRKKVEQLRDNLSTLPKGKDHARDFEDWWANFLPSVSIGPSVILSRSRAPTQGSP
jgi:Cdc6-like AAA superfamily ATPase